MRKTEEGIRAVLKWKWWGNYQELKKSGNREDLPVFPLFVYLFPMPYLYNKNYQVSLIDI